jgi:hypothetical protein
MGKRADYGVGRRSLKRWLATFLDGLLDRLPVL